MQVHFIDPLNGHVRGDSYLCLRLKSARGTCTLKHALASAGPFMLPLGSGLVLRGGHCSKYPDRHRSATTAHSKRVGVPLPPGRCRRAPVAGSNIGRGGPQRRAQHVGRTHAGQAPHGGRAGAQRRRRGERAGCGAGGGLGGPLCEQQRGASGPGASAPARRHLACAWPSALSAWQLVLPMHIACPLAALVHAAAHALPHPRLMFGHSWLSVVSCRQCQA